MKRRTFAKAIATVTGGSLVAPILAGAQGNTSLGTPDASPVPSAASQTGYAPVNGLEMYYEIHGAGSGTPLVLLHGGLTTIAFAAPLMQALAQTRPVIALAQQGHGRTADIDRPITYDNMVADTAAAIAYLELGQADIVGYSMGGTTGLGLAIAHPDLVRKLVTISSPFNNDQGFRPENLAGSRSVTAEALAGSPLEAGQMAVAPHPEQWPDVVAKIAEMNRTWPGWAPDDLRAIAAPTMIMVGDADGIRLDHTLDLLRLRGGDVNGDFAGVPPSRLAVLPGATHFSIITQVDLLHSIIQPYLDEPMPETT